MSSEWLSGRLVGRFRLFDVRAKSSVKSKFKANVPVRCRSVRGCQVAGNAAGGEFASEKLEDNSLLTAKLTNEAANIELVFSFDN